MGHLPPRLHPFRTAPFPFGQFRAAIGAVSTVWLLILFSALAVHAQSVDSRSAAPSEHESASSREEVASSQEEVASTQEAFSTLRMGLSGGLVFRENGMPGWTPGTDVRLTIDSPYAGGRLRFDASYRAWTGQQDFQGAFDRAGSQTTADLPDVQTIDVMAGWGVANASGGSISLDAGLLIGNRFMLFDLPADTAGRFESEMLAGPWIRIGRQVGAFLVFTEVRALRVLTNPRWETVGVSAGLALERSTPGWIRWILE